MYKQQSIPVGCVLPASRSYVFQWSSDVSTSEVGVDPQVNKFGKVSSLSPVMWLAGFPCTLRFHVQGGCVARIGGGEQDWGQEGICTVRSHVQKQDWVTTGGRAPV